jgi:sulfate/thiosulfate transport system ATP-binding protein
VLLLDEPFGALDARVRKDLRRWLRRLHDELHVTSVFVTHDQEEALELSDRVVVMNHGRIEQEGTPDEVYHSPSTPFVYRFLGDVNLFHGREYARPHEIEVFREASIEGSIPAKVEHIAPRGAVVRVELTATAANGTLEVELTREQQRALALLPGENVFVRPRVLRVFEPAVKQAA